MAISPPIIDPMGGSACSRLLYLPSCRVCKGYCSNLNARFHQNYDRHRMEILRYTQAGKALAAAPAAFTASPASLQLLLLLLLRYLLLLLLLLVP